MDTQKIIKNYDNIVDTFLLNFNDRFSEIINTIGTEHIKLTQGDRLRPQMCLWGFLASIDLDDIDTTKFNSIVELSVAIELLYQSTVLLNDLVDIDNTRRMKPLSCVINIIEWSTKVIKDICQKSKTVYLLHGMFKMKFIDILDEMYSFTSRRLVMTKEDIPNEEFIQEISNLQQSDIIHQGFMCGYTLGCGVHNKSDELFEENLAKISSYCGFHLQYYYGLKEFVDQIKDYKSCNNNVDFNIAKFRRNLIMPSLECVVRFYHKKKFREGDMNDLISLVDKYNIVRSELNTLQTSEEIIIKKVKNIEFNCFYKDWYIGFSNFILKLFEHLDNDYCWDYWL